MSPHLNGLRYLREAIKIAVLQPESKNALKDVLYPTVATKFNTTSTKVETAIQYAIKYAWNRGRTDVINSLFGGACNANEKPTNGKFIALVADKILLECLPT